MPDLRDQDEETLLTSPATQETAVHVTDYLRFTQMMKWGALVCLVIGLLSLMLIKAYW